MTRRFILAWRIEKRGLSRYGRAPLSKFPRIGQRGGRASGERNDRAGNFQCFTRDPVSPCKQRRYRATRFSPTAFSDAFERAGGARDAAPLRAGCCCFSLLLLRHSRVEWQEFALSESFPLPSAISARVASGRRAKRGTSKGTPFAACRGRRGAKKVALIDEYFSLFRRGE